MKEEYMIAEEYFRKQIKKIIERLDEINRPYSIYIHPKDAELLRDAFPECDERFLIYETELVERGKCYCIERKKLKLDFLEKWYE